MRYAGYRVHDTSHRVRLGRHASGLALPAIGRSGCGSRCPLRRWKPGRYGEVRGFAPYAVIRWIPSDQPPRAAASVTLTKELTLGAETDRWKKLAIVLPVVATIAAAAISGVATYYSKASDAPLPKPQGLNTAVVQPTAPILSAGTNNRAKLRKHGHEESIGDWVRANNHGCHAGRLEMVQIFSYG